MRIASLLASGTEIVCALGLDRDLVAISHECDYPAHVLDRPRVSRARFDPEGLSSGEIDRAVRGAMAQYGSVYELDTEVLRRVAPDLVITQAVCAVCAVPRTLAEEALAVLGSGATTVSLDAHTVSEILESIENLGRAAGFEARASVLAREIQARISAVTARTRKGSPPTVLALEWLDPPFAPGHWVPEMVQAAGGRNLVGDAGRPSTQLSWDELTGLDPDVLVVMPCGFGLHDACHAADRHHVALETVAGRAIACRRAFVVDGSSYFNRSGPRVADGIEILGRLLHPDLFSESDLSGRADAWVPASSTQL